MATRILVVGSRGHAVSVLGAIVAMGRLAVVGLVDCFRHKGEEEQGYPVVGTIDDLPALCERLDAWHVVVAVGHNQRREEVQGRVRALVPDARFPAVVDPTVVLRGDVEIGSGCVLLAGGVVQPGVRMGEGCLLNTRCSLDHESTLGDFVSLGPGCSVGGRCRLGKRSAIGIGASVIQRVSIGGDTVVGAGAAVVGDLPAGVLAVGVPARVKRERPPGAEYL